MGKMGPGWNWNDWSEWASGSRKPSRELTSLADTGGIELGWGKAEAMIAMLEKIVRREGLGDILADGVIAVMRSIGAPNGLAGLGYTSGDLDALTDKGWKQRRVVDNAARPISREEMREIFAGALTYW